MFCYKGKGKVKTTTKKKCRLRQSCSFKVKKLIHVSVVELKIQCIL